MSPAPITYEVRVLVCNHCGAPVHARPAGGAFTCAFCHAVNTVAARRDRPEDFRLASPPPGPGGSGLSEPERFASLRAQDALSDPLTRPPDALRRYFMLGAGEAALTDLPPRWNEQRRLIEAGAGEEVEREFYWITSALRTHLLTGKQDHVRARALVETAADTVRDPVLRTLLTLSLANRATDAGDLASADAWLRPVDRRSPILAVHSDYVLSRARLEYARQNWPGVFEAVGAHADDVPVAALDDPAACMWRAAAYESSGDVPAAVTALWEARRHFFQRIRLRDRLRSQIDAIPGPPLCARSFPRFEERLRRDQRPVRWSLVAVGLALGAFGIHEVVAWTSHSSTPHSKATPAHQGERRGR